MVEIKIFAAGEERPIVEALEVLSDEFLDDRGSCVQTTIDLRDAAKYLLGRCAAVERLYNLTVADNLSGQDIDDLMTLKAWYRTEVQGRHN